MKIHVAVDIDATPAEVWSDVQDISSHVDWMHDAVRISFVGDQRSGVGTQFDVATRVGPLRTTDRMVITDWQPAAAMGVRHEGLVSGVGNFTLLGRGNRTTFAWSESLTFPWWFGGRLGEVVAKPILTSIWRRNLKLLKARIEQRFDGDDDAQIGALVASGRDGALYEYGRRWVIRHSKDGRDQSQQRELLRWLASVGYPVPTVADHPDPTALVMERIDGPTMLNDLAAKPWKLNSHAKLLADLHRRLDALEPPDNLPRLGTGTHLVHLDLHPNNVLLGPDGPVVIDWANAAIGNRDLDRAMTWVLLKTGEVDGNAVLKSLVSTLRDRFAATYEAAAGTDAIAAHATTAAELKLLDANLRAGEHEAMFRLARDVQNRPTHSRTDDV
jgi:aminoglycoside phosphotransferase (APT) family kinase protein